MASVDGWRVVDGAVSAWFEVDSLSAAARLAGRVAELVVDGGYEVPAMDLRGGGVRIRGRGSSAWALAGEISRVARERGLEVESEGLQVMKVVVGARDVRAVTAFWRTALGYVDDDGLRDPLRRDPDFVVCELEEKRPLRNRIHVDVGRVPEAVEEVHATLRQQPYGPYGLTLADGEGNELDLVPGGGPAESAEVADWRVPFSGMAFYRTETLTQACELAATVARIADGVGWPLAVDLRADGVTIDSGKDVWEDEQLGEVRFAELAAQVQEAARGMGLSADPSRLRFVQLAIDAVDVPRVRGFWARLLGYELDAREFLTDIYDPRRLGPVLMFQQLEVAEEERRKQRNRIRFDLLVPADQLEIRVATAIAGGGRIVGEKTPDRCLVADPEGNEVEISAQSSS